MKTQIDKAKEIMKELGMDTTNKILVLNVATIYLMGGTDYIKDQLKRK